MSFPSWNADNRLSAGQTPISLSLLDEGMRSPSTLWGSLSRLADISTCICLELLHIGGNPQLHYPTTTPGEGFPTASWKIRFAAYGLFSTVIVSQWLKLSLPPPRLRNEAQNKTAKVKFLNLLSKLKWRKQSNWLNHSFRIQKCTHGPDILKKEWMLSVQ